MNNEFKNELEYYENAHNYNEYQMAQDEDCSEKIKRIARGILKIFFAKHPMGYPDYVQMNKGLCDWAGVVLYKYFKLTGDYDNGSLKEIINDKCFGIAYLNLIDVQDLYNKKILNLGSTDVAPLFKSGGALQVLWESHNNWEGIGNTCEKSKEILQPLRYIQRNKSQFEIEDEPSKEKNELIDEYAQLLEEHEYEGLNEFELENELDDYAEEMYNEYFNETRRKRRTPRRKRRKRKGGGFFAKAGKWLKNNAKGIAKTALKGAASLIPGGSLVANTVLDAVLPEDEEFYNELQELELSPTEAAYFTKDYFEAVADEFNEMEPEDEMEARRAIQRGRNRTMQKYQGRRPSNRARATAGRNQQRDRNQGGQNNRGKTRRIELGPGESILIVNRE